MSSGFVSAGTTEEPVERDDEWRRVQQELEEGRRRKAELGKQGDGKSLYEVLQQNKMAKQEAFEEKIKLKNQFRSLDEDEVEFLDSLLESTRAQEAAVKKDTAEQLEAFRRQREEAEKAALEGASTEAGPSVEEEQWAISSRKRRREKNKDLLLPGKKRKSSAAEDATRRLSQTEQTTSSSAKVIGHEEARPASASSPAVKSPETSDLPKKPAVATKPAENAIATNTSPIQTKPVTKPAPVSLGLDAYSDSE